MRPIPYGRHWIDEEDIARVVEVLGCDWLTQGPVVDRFERALADYCGAKHAVAVSNGTAALQISCMAAGIGPGDEGITSPITFLASATCLIHSGAKPVFADICSKTWNIDPSEIEQMATPRTKVVIPVHFAGLPCDMEAIRKIADRRGWFVIEDACHAIGATFGGKRIGGTKTADMVCFSFHPVKHITTGEGGAVLTDDDKLATNLRALRHHGLTKDPSLLERNDGPWYYEAQQIGLNARLTDIQCALGLSQLKKLDQFLARRRDIAARYTEAFGDLPGVRVQSVPTGYDHVYHLYVVHLDPARHDRLKVFESLRVSGISPQIHYIPLHHQPAIRNKMDKSVSLPETERYYAGCISLPMFPSLGEGEQDLVIHTLEKACS